jgi:hypothetical protein
MNPTRKKIIWIFLAIIIFIVGYYLRSYLAIHHALALSPYEAFKFGSFGDNNLFSIKMTSYPIGLLAEKVLNPLLGNFYLIYILGSFVIFLLGKKISGNNLGGFFAFALFAMAPDNLLQYTGRMYASGLCYIAILTALLFFLYYLENKKNINLLAFIFFGIIVIASYHTGAMAYIIILLGIFIIQLLSKKPLDKKIVTSFFFLSLFYGLWLMIFDDYELWIISDSLIHFIGFGDWQKAIAILISGLIGLFTVITISKNKKTTPWLLGTALIASTILIFSDTSIFRNIFLSNDSNYYISITTFNNYLAQIILIHVFLLLTIKEILRKDNETKNTLLWGWILGLIIIFVGLLLEGYYVRIIDFSAPLMFIAFGWYLSQKPKFWKITAALTLILMLVSQIIIYNDPFTMRRYYDQNEIESAKKIIELNLRGTTISDLRTASLINYFGNSNVTFGMIWMPRFNTVFYDYENINAFIKQYNYKKESQRDINVILSKSMKTVMYSTNTITKPFNNEIFNFYQENFPQIYNDELLEVYQIYHTTSTKLLKK